MFNTGYLKALWGITKIYKLNFIILSAILSVVLLLLTILFNFYSFFNTYKSIQSGFVPELIYLDKNISTFDQFRKKVGDDILKDSLYGFYEEKELDFLSQARQHITTKNIYIFHNIKTEHYSLNITHDNKKYPLKIIDMRQSFDVFTIKIQNTTIPKGQYTLRFKDQKIETTLKKYSAYSTLTFNLKKDDYISFYKIINGYISQFVDINRSGIQQTYQKKSDKSSELRQLQSTYDDAIRTYLKFLAQKDKVIMSENLYDQISDYHRKALKIITQQNKTKEEMIVLNKISFPNENIEQKKLNYFMFKNTDLESTQPKHFFLFYYGKETKTLIDTLKDEEIVLNNQMIPSILLQEKVSFNAMITLVILFTLITVIVLVTLLNSFYKTYAREIFFLKSYGFTTPLFFLFSILSFILALVISGFIIDNYFYLINSVMEQYFFPQIKFSFFYEYLLPLFGVIYTFIYINETSKFNKLSYSTKEEL